MTQTQTTDLPTSCWLCGTRDRLTYSHLCAQCAGVTTPPTRCQAPIRCYCPEHLGAPRLTEKQAVAAIRDELAAARARRAARAERA